MSDIARTNQIRVHYYVQCYVKLFVLIRNLQFFKLIIELETKKAEDAAITDTTVNHYDNLDRLDDSTQRGVLIDYAYDNNGNRTMVSTPHGNTAYTFNRRNRLETATTDGLTTTYTYYPDGKKKLISYPNGTAVSYTYFDTNRTKDVVNKATSSVSIISSYSYGYDLNGNRTSQTELQNGVSETTIYTYDLADRMKDFTVTGASTTKTEYTFDGYNRKTEEVTENGTVVSSKTYAYDETNWLKTIADSVQQSAISYEYDNNGNMRLKADSLSADSTMMFVYDSRNQLIEVKRGPPGSETVLGQYDYNFEGLRVRHRLSERGDVDYYYDDDAVIEERNTTGNSLLAHYSYGDRLISMGTANDIQYYHYDALGSTVNLTTTSGGTQTSYQLNPWGHIRKQYGLSLNRHIFTGQEHDYNTGLIYFGARYYDPDTARFITQDSYLGEPGTPPSLHRYLYAYSNPTVYVDLQGYFSIKEAWDTFKEAYDLTPIGMNTKLAKTGLETMSAGLDYWSNQADEYVEKNAPGNAMIVGLTAAKTILTVSKGIVDTPKSMEEQTNKFVQRPSLETLPVLGEIGTNLGESAAIWAEDKNTENTAKLFGAASAAFLTVAPFMPKGVKLSGAVADEAALTAESASARAASAIKPVSTAQNMVQKVLQKLETAYKESPVGNEVGALGSKPISHRFKKAAIDREFDMLQKDIGYNISPESWFSVYKHLGRSGMYITDYRAIGEILGPVRANRQYSVGIFSGHDKFSFLKEWRLERALGLERGSLREGFRITRVSSITDRAPRSPIVGNKYFPALEKDCQAVVRNS